MSEITLQNVSNFRETSGLIKESLVGLTNAQLEWKPAVDKWSVKEVVAHLVDSSLVHSIRIRKIVSEESPEFTLYHQDAWVSSSHANQSSLQDILHAFDAVLAYNALFYERLTLEQWDKKTLNNDKEISISDLFQGFIRHVNIHIAQIKRTIQEIPGDI